VSEKLHGIGRENELCRFDGNTILNIDKKKK